MSLYKKASILSLLTASVLSHAEPPAVTLYLIGYDIPDEQRMSLVAQDVAAFEVYQKKRLNFSYFNQMTEDAPKSQRDQYPIINTRELTLCDFNELDICLTQIQANSEPFRQSLQILEPVFADIDKLRLAHPNKIKSVFPNRLQLASNPLPSYQLITKPLLTRNALAYLDNPNQAMIQICEDIIFSKSLVQSQQSLIQSLVGNAMLNHQLKLLAHSSQPLPKNCRNALQPMATAITSICPLMKSEGSYMANEMMAMSSVPILFSRNATVKHFEKVADPYCSREWSEKVSDDEWVSTPRIKNYNPLLFNKVGAMAINFAMPDYSAYQHRLQDSNAHLRLWQAALNPQCEVNTEGYVASIANNWHADRQLRLDDNGRLSVTTYNENNTSDKQLSVSCRSFHDR